MCVSDWFRRAAMQTNRPDYKSDSAEHEQHFIVVPGDIPIVAIRGKEIKHIGRSDDLGEQHVPRPWTVIFIVSTCVCWETNVSADPNDVVRLRPPQLVRGGVPERMMEQRPVQQQQHQAQWIPQQPPPQLPQQQAPIQQAQPQPQQIQQQQLHQQQSSYDDHYDSYGDSKMPKDAKLPYNPPANATIQSVEIGQTDIPKYPPPQPQESATSNVAALNVRSQISPRQIVATPQQQQQYQLLFIIP
ncbi:hypothetical protein quinque_002396 [Culex quinquefasciatus]